MKEVKIHLLDASLDGAITMESSQSQFKAVRIDKSHVSVFATDLNHPGIYFLLIGSDTIYVGETGLDSIGKRIVNTHSGSIDSSWHTVVAFPCTNDSITQNELRYLENAMCEYVINNYPNCATTTPAAKNCNAAYRNTHYKLTSGGIVACTGYIDDITHYISLFPTSIFPGSGKTAPPTPQPTTPKVQTDIFCYDNPKRDAHGKAVIEIHCGHNGKRKTVLLKGSQISNQVSTAFTSHTSVIALRDQYEKAGKIVNRVLQEDIEFASQSGAGQFLNGTSFDGNGCWKTVKGDVPLKKLL